MIRLNLVRFYSRIFFKTSSGTSLGWLARGSTPEGSPPTDEALVLTAEGPELVEGLGVGGGSVFSKIKSFNLFISSGLAARSPPATPCVALRAGLECIVSLSFKASSEIGSLILFKTSFKARFSPPARTGFDLLSGIKTFLIAPNIPGLPAEEEG